MALPLLPPPRTHSSSDLPTPTSQPFPKLFYLECSLSLGSLCSWLWSSAFPLKGLSPPDDLNELPAPHFASPHLIILCMVIITSWHHGVCSCIGHFPMGTQPARTVWLSSPLHPQCHRAYWHLQAGSSCQLDSQDYDELSGTLRQGRRGQQLLATCPAACGPFFHQHQRVAPMVKTKTE